MNTDTVGSGFGVDVIYLNYSKVFNSVPYLQLIGKLKSYGIGDKFITLVRKFLA